MAGTLIAPAPPGVSVDEDLDVDRAELSVGTETEDAVVVDHADARGVGAERLDERVDVARSDLDDEPADRFAEQRGRRVVVGKRIDRGAEAAADAHLGDAPLPTRPR